MSFLPKLLEDNEKVAIFAAKEIIMEELRNIFASSCIEAAARKMGCSTGEMYHRMKRVGLIHGFILPGYEALHSQSREHVTEDVLGALKIWEEKQGIETGSGG